ncbi:DUF5671 domain-containing protein [Microbacterium pumilum]|uniref:DUF5671 domain-containing protein n=1 Tax=Microbacterium pumilum TaxID=344165 RepID=A0ABN2SZD6_9MICO
MSAAPARASGGAGTVIRRIILFSILYALVVVAAIGLSGLIERVIGAPSVIVGDDSGLARSLAFTFIGVPLAGVLWWWQRRRLADPGERASLVWALYLTAMSLTSLIVATVSIASAANAGIDGEWRPGELAAGTVWAGVWLWHRHMRLSAATAPTRLAELPVELGALYGLIAGATGAIAAVASLISEALVDVGAQLVASQDWYVPVLQGIVWCLIGGLVWWWHWFRDHGRTASGAFAGVLLVIVIGAATATTLFSIGTALFVLLRVLFDSDPIGEVLSPLDVAIAATLIGAIVWIYHAQELATRSERTRRAARLVISAIALIGAASGFGVIVNALLATLGPTLVDDDPRTLLLGGISALVVSGPAWWLAWRPDRPTSADAADQPRRVYLVAVFGASAVVALVTLLIIGFRVFEFALDVGEGGGLVERIRAPLGLLSATVLVFGYHFAVWRHDRALAPAAPTAPRREIGRVILVTAGEPGDGPARIRETTGAAVTVWAAADAEARLDDEGLTGLLESLTDVTAPRVLVIAQPGGGASVVPLAD